MGIKGFSAWLRSKFPSAFAAARIPCVFDEIYIDLNSYLYQSALRSTSPQQVLKHLQTKLLYTLSNIRARKRIFISIDGVAPVAKLDVQRSRRASKALESARSKLFDAQHFTPGCLFMGQVEERLRELAPRIMAKQKSPDFEFIISGASVKEEGEVKIAQEIALQDRLHGRSRRVARAVLTVDSDAFLQAFVHDIPSLFVLNASDLKSGKVACFSGEMMRDQFGQLLAAASLNADQRQARLDFALLGILSGNDCVPAMPFGGVASLWPVYLEFVQAGCGLQAGLVDPQTQRVSLEGLVAFARHALTHRMDAATQRLVEQHRSQGVAAEITAELMVDYLAAVQWSFGRLIGSPVAQALSLFTGARTPTFYDLAGLDLATAQPLFQAACEARENKLDRRKLPGAAAIMMLDGTGGPSAEYIAAPLRPLFTAFHADEACTLDDHERFKRLCRAILEIPREQFSREEAAVTFPRLPEVATKQRPRWRAYDPPGRSRALDRPYDCAAEGAGAPPPAHDCPVFVRLFGRQSAGRLGQRQPA